MSNKPYGPIALVEATATGPWPPKLLASTMLPRSGAKFVNSSVDLAGKLLRRHVGDRAETQTSAGEIGLPRELGDAEIDDFHFTALGEHHVGGFDVAVDDAGIMGRGQAAGDLLGYRARVIDRQRSTLDTALERLAVVEAHRDEHAAIDGLVDVVDGADVRIIEG